MKRQGIFFSFAKILSYNIWQSHKRKIQVPLPLEPLIDTQEKSSPFVSQHFYSSCLQKCRHHFPLQPQRSSSVDLIAFLKCGDTLPLYFPLWNAVLWNMQGSFDLEKKTQRYLLLLKHICGLFIKLWIADNKMICIEHDLCIYSCLLVTSKSQS